MKFILSLLCFCLINAASLAKDPVLDIQLVTSPSGISAWLVEDHSVPVISMQIGFDYGSAQDPKVLSGLSTLLSNTLDEGAGEIGAQKFQQILSDKSITLSFASDRDNFYGNVKTLTKHKDDAFKLLRLALTKPRFDEAAVARMVAANQSRIRSALSDPEWIAARIANDKAYENHPYAMNSGGTLHSLTKITPVNLKEAFKSTITKENLRIAVTGDISKDELSALLDKVFSGLPESRPHAPIKDIKVQHRGETFYYTVDVPQTFIEMHWDGISRQSEEYYIALLMNHILGSSGFGSRLTEDIREKQGLTYGIYTSLRQLDHAPSLTLSTSTENKNVPIMLDSIEKIVQQFVEDGVTDEELRVAKQYMIGSLPLQLLSTDNISSILLGIQLDDLPMNYLDRREAAIERVTKKDIQRIAQQLLTKPPLIILSGNPVFAEDYIAQKLETIPNAE